MDNVFFVFSRLVNFSILVLFFVILIRVRMKVFFNSLNIMDMVVEVGIFKELKIFNRIMFVIIIVRKIYINF